MLLCANARSTNAQQWLNLFSNVDTAQQQLSQDQLERFNLIREQGIYTAFQFVHTEAISTRLHSDSLKVTFTQPQACQDMVFLAANVEYEADSDYYWYGKVAYVDSSAVTDTTCATKGHIMLLSKDGEIGGQIVTEWLKYNILELGNGLQVIAQVNADLENAAQCGVGVRKAGLPKHITRQQVPAFALFVSWWCGRRLLWPATQTG